MIYENKIKSDKEVTGYLALSYQNTRTEQNNGGKRIENKTYLSSYSEFESARKRYRLKKGKNN